MSSKAKQQNYRRLMKEVKGKSSSQQQKIDHPLARYNALDQLSCIVCQQVVKSELLWGTHLKSKRHKEIVTELKNKRDALQTNTSGSGRGKGDRSDPATHPPNPPALKKNETEAASGDVDLDGCDVPEHEPPNKKQKVKIDATEGKKTWASLPADFFDPGVSKKFGKDADSDEEGREEVEMVKGDSEGGVSEKSDDKKSMSSKDSKTENNSSADRKVDEKTALPEGFFDDPKMDAKARNVEYRDKLDDEWEKFQKTIQKENDISEAIQFKDDEEIQGGRNLTEVQEQVACFERAEALRLKQEELLEKRRESVSGEGDGEGVRGGGEVVSEVNRGDSGEDSSSDVDDELDMDWRAKQS